MSRVIKRVPLNFEWPLGVKWEGYLMPERLREARCPQGVHCLNGGTAARAWVTEVVRLLLMLDDDRRDQAQERPMHPYFGSVPAPHATGEDLFTSLRGQRAFVPPPSPDIAEFGTGLAGRAAGFLGHDCLNEWAALSKVVTAAGLDPERWGICPACEGHASVEAYPGQRAEADAWERTEPPAGEGWQLWETVSEGSPVSPAFGSDEELARWLTTTEGGQAIGPPHQPLTIEQARGFIRAGWAPSFTEDAGGLHEGVTFVGTDTALRGEGAP